MIGCVCVLSAWFGDICGIRGGTLICFSNFNYRVRFISNSALFVAAACTDTDETSRVCEAAVNRSALAIDTLCSKKSYDMRHMWCGIRALLVRDFPHW